MVSTLPSFCWWSTFSPGPPLALTAEDRALIATRGSQLESSIRRPYCGCSVPQSLWPTNQNAIVRKEFTTANNIAALYMLGEEVLVQGSKLHWSSQAFGKAVQKTVKQNLHLDT